MSNQERRKLKCRKVEVLRKPLVMCVMHEEEKFRSGICEGRRQIYSGEKWQVRSGSGSECEGEAKPRSEPSEWAVNAHYQGRRSGGGGWKFQHQSTVTWTSSELHYGFRPE